MVVFALGLALQAAPVADPSSTSDPVHTAIESVPTLALQWASPPPSELQAALLAHLHDLPAHIVVEVEPGHEVDAVLTLTRIPEGAWRLTVDRSDGSPPWSRTLVDVPESPAATREALAVALRSAAKSALETKPVPQAPAIAPPPTRRRAGWGTATVSYQGGTYAAQVPWLSGARLDLGWQERHGFTVTLAYTLMQSIHVSVAGGLLTVARHPLELTVGWLRPPSEERRRVVWVYGADAGLLIEPTVRRAFSRAADVVAATEDVRTSAGMVVRARTGLRWSRFTVSVGVGPELWFSRTRYAVDTPLAGPRAVLTTHAVRLVAIGGLGVRW